MYSPLLPLPFSANQPCLSFRHVHSSATKHSRIYNLQLYHECDLRLGCPYDRPQRSYSAHHQQRLLFSNTQAMSAAMVRVASGRLSARALLLIHRSVTGSLSSSLTLSAILRGLLPVYTPNPPFTTYGTLPYSCSTCKVNQQTEDVI